MPEIGRTLAFAAALLMGISLAIWLSWLRGPLLQRLDGPRALTGRRPPLRSIVDRGVRGELSRRGIRDQLMDLPLGR
jgi:hypothetical protein